MTLFWILFHSHILFLANVTQIAPNLFVRYFQSGVESLSSSYYLLIIKTFLLPLLMVIFALLIVRNIRKVRRVAVVPILTATGTTRRNELQSTNPSEVLMKRVRPSIMGTQ